MQGKVTCDDEWEEIHKRFVVEGLDAAQLSSKQKSLYLWRWLVDAENNMVTSRKMLEKAREQHSDEMKEVESFVEHIQLLSSEAAKKLEDDNANLKEEVDRLRHKPSSDARHDQVTEMIMREGLEEIVQSTLDEQVAYLLVLRSRLMEELESERKQIASLKAEMKENKHPSEQSNYEQEMKHQLELTKHVKEEMKKKHDLELGALQSKLNESYQKIQQLESATSKGSDKIAVSGEHNNVNADSDHLRNKLVTMEDRLKKLQHAKRQLEIDNETLTFKISELLAECEDKESQLRKERMKSIGINSCSRKNSVDFDSSKRHSIINMDNNFIPTEMSWQQQIRKLQADVENLQDQLLNVGSHNDTLAARYQHRKSDVKTKMQRIKDVFQVRHTSLKDQICDLENSLVTVQTSLIWEKECRQKIQNDFAVLLREKSDLMKRFLDCDEDLRDKSNQLKTLVARTTNLEEENAKICQEVAILKTLVLKEVFVNASESKKKDLKESFASDWLNRIQLATTRSNTATDTAKNKSNDEVNV